MHSHFVCAMCPATKGDVLEGRPFAIWPEELHCTDLLPTVPVWDRCECPLHGTRIITSQMLRHSCSSMREWGVSARKVADLKKVLELEDWEEKDNLDHTVARDLICDKKRFYFGSSFITIISGF